jgi:hypothetical protein
VSEERDIVRSLRGPFEPRFSEGRWVFHSEPGGKMARSVETWLRAHPEIEVRAVIPVVEHGQLQEMWVIPK